MYHMSQSYTSMSGSRLEYIAHSAVNYSTRSSSQLAYATVIPVSSPVSFSYQSPSTAPTVSYSQSASALYTFFSPQAEYHFRPEQFLKPGKEGLFVGEAERIRPFIEEAFEKI